jgi:Rps23 Pro-64 3,4-dihydroxylase Tpa1-like proline 4-hydroxylase
VITGLLGGVVSKKWDDLTQERIISTRAKSSVRNLQLLLDNSISLEKRVISFIKRITDPSNKNNVTSEVIKTYFEEIITQCLTIENFIINSIQDWTDILPQANIESVITNIREMKNNIVELQSRLDSVNHELELSKEKTLEEIQEKEILIKEKGDLEAKLSDLYQESLSSANRAGYPTISGSLVTGGTIDSQAYLHRSNDLPIKWKNPFSKNDPPEVDQSK